MSSYVGEKPITEQGKKRKNNGNLISTTNIRLNMHKQYLRLTFLKRKIFNTNGQKYKQQNMNRLT